MSSNFFKFHCPIKHLQTVTVTSSATNKVGKGISSVAVITVLIFSNRNIIRNQEGYNCWVVSSLHGFREDQIKNTASISPCIIFMRNRGNVFNNPLLCNGCLRSITHMEDYHTFITWLLFGQGTVYAAFC
jgi:hypothetical protein